MNSSPPTSTSAFESADRPARSGELIALLGLSSLITGLDFTIVYVALPDIAADLGLSPYGLQWVISAYAIAFGGFLLLAGRLVDLFGARRVFLGGMVLFTVGSVLGALSATPELLIGARALQGIGAALLFPSTLTLVMTSFEEGRQRDRALGVWAAAGSAGLSLGALAGGILTDLTGWQGVFWVNLPMTGASILAASRLIPGNVSREAGGRLDLPGAVTGTVGMTLLVFTIAQGPELGWTSGRVLLAGVCGLLLLACFIAIEAVSTRPLLPLSLFRNPNLRVASVVILLFGMTLNTVPYVLTQFFQTILNFSALQAGLAFLVPTTAITVGTLVGEKLIALVGIRNVLLLALLIGGAGTFAISLVLAEGGGLLMAAPAIAAFGLGLGTVYPAMFSAAATGVSGPQAGVASGFSSTALQLGSAIGLAVVVAVSTHSGHEVAQVRTGLQDGLYLVTAGAFLAALTTLLLPRQAGVGKGEFIPEDTPIPG
jgi:EmrB/QacA subfamily drug resistance transporter